MCDKVDNLKKRIQSNKSMENEDKFLFEGQEWLSHAFLFVHTSLKPTKHMETNPKSLQKQHGYKLKHFK